ncbi:MAG: SPASM domain-containing protein [Candidatus Omnitrophica bacterium]|nr:SPASM domain-containing protein [Candidatus Omnitrophota bacterium]
MSLSVKNKLISIGETLNAYWGWARYGVFGKSIRLDVSTICQLKCIDCSHGKNDIGILGIGYMEFEKFKDFVNRYPHFKHIEISNWGEIFLNPQLDAILRYAFQKKISLTAINGVNLNTAKNETLENLVKYRLREMTVSIDGASNDTYKIYRCGGDFGTVIENINRINYYKLKYHSEFPILGWQFIVFPHNEHELALAREKASALNMRFIPKLNWNEKAFPVKDLEFVRKEIKYASREERWQKTHRLYMPACGLLWTSPQINWDGKLLGCTENKWCDFGNVFDLGLAKCMHNPRYLYMKKMLLALEKPEDDIPCLKCFKYKEVQLLSPRFRDLELRPTRSPWVI